jgi:hypothetical protein
MSSRRFTVPLALLALAACSDQQGDAPTGPSLAGGKPVPPAACNFSLVSQLTKDAFGASSTQSGWAGDMKLAGAGTAAGTVFGYQILGSIGTPRIAEQATLRSELAFELLKCMAVGDAVTAQALTKTSFVSALGTTGAFGVAGASADDAAAIASADGAWLIQPPTGKTWQEIVVAPTGLSKTFLAYGSPSDILGFTNDEPLGEFRFDWHVIPNVTFDTSDGQLGVIVANCDAEAPGYMQHNALGSNPEVLGYIDFSCASNFGATKERAPRNFAERLFRAVSPQPAVAASTLGTGTAGGKGSLSPFGVINPGRARILFTSIWSKSGNVVNVPFKPLVEIETRSLGGSPFLQKDIFVWLEATNNSGTNVLVCNNWDYTDVNGKAQFENAFLNKAGGYTMKAFTIGTTGEVREIDGDGTGGVGSTVTGFINVKNSSVAQPSCSVYIPGSNLAEFPQEGPNNSN